MTSRLLLRDVLTVVRELRRDEDVVVTTMSAAREWLQGPSHPRDLVFVPSSMSHATSVALGIALAQPRRRVIVCNGDGSMLMNLGSLATIAAAAPPNLTVLILENGVYQVTGSQPLPVGQAIDYGAIARGCGIRSVFHFDDAAAWRSGAAGVLAATGPSVAVLPVAPDDAPGPRSPGRGPDRARAFQQALAT